MPTTGSLPSGCRLGVLAFGDSITNAGGELQWGVALQSWALWTARGLGLPYTGLAVDGARARDLVGSQLTAFEAQVAAPGASFDLGCLYVGVNDVRALDWDAVGFAADLETAVRFLGARCDRVLLVTIPLDLGRPRAGAHKVSEANRLVRDSAARHGALLLELEDFGARNHVMTDHVHPTAFGQIAIAERALDVLAAHGMTVRARPSSLISYAPTRRGRLRADVTYTYRHLKVSVRAATIVVRYRLGLMPEKS